MFRALYEDRVVEVPADAACYPHEPGLVSARQALRTAFGSGARERQHKSGAIAGYRTQDGQLGGTASEVIEDRSDS